MNTNRRLLGPVLAFGLLSAFVLTGCASKSHSVRTPSRTSTQLSSVDADEKKAENPILFEEEFEALERGEVPTYDIPIDRNAKVEQWLAYFQGKGRKWYHLWLERSGRYIPVMRKILRDHDLPEDLVYLAMIESGFSARAYSRARAVGIWQFMKGTARLYSLRIDFWVDERRDPEKATLAAARHLKDLYDQFQSWKLAAAAYNAGSGKVSRAIKKYKTEDFWELTKGRYLRPETRHYVPKMIAAALIAKEPEKYGFTNIQYESPLAYDKIILEEPVNLVLLAEKAGYDLEDLIAINPELNHPVPPPDVEKYELRVPSGTSEKFLVSLDALKDDQASKMAAHKIRKGDTLAKLAKIYGIRESEISKYNGLRGVRSFHTGQIVMIPVAMDERLVALGKQVSRAEDHVRRSRRKATRREALDSVYRGASSSTVNPKAMPARGTEKAVKKKSISSDLGRTFGQSPNVTASR